MEPPVRVAKAKAPPEMMPRTDGRAVLGEFRTVHRDLLERRLPEYLRLDPNLVRVKSPLGSGLRFWTGNPTVRKAGILSGSGMAQEANAGGRKASGSRGVVIAPPAVAPDNRPDTGAAQPERGLKWAG